MSNATPDRRKPIDGNGHELRARMGGRVPVDRYMDVLNALLQRVNGDLANLEAGRLADTKAERDARDAIRQHLVDARDGFLLSLGHVQQIRDPRLKFTLGAVSVGPLLRAEGLTEQALDVVWRMHARGRWGAASADERDANGAAVQLGRGRIVSRHTVGSHNVVIVTEADRSATRIMTAAKY